MIARALQPRLPRWSVIATESSIRSLGVKVATGAALTGGGFVAVQARINGELGARLESGLWAALISFGGGLIIIAAVVAGLRSERAALRRMVAAIRSTSQPWWLFCGGALGAGFVFVQSYVVAIAGVALFVVAAVAGQTVGGLLVDRVGIGSMKPRAWQPNRIIGSAVMVIAAIIGAFPSLRGSDGLWVLVLPILAGFAISVQAALNGQVRQITSMAAATLSNFVVGTTVLLAACVATVLVGRQPVPQFPPEPWLYLGGIIGVIFIALGAALVNRIGVLVLNLSLITGQLVISVVLDLLYPVAGRSVGAHTVISTTLALLAVLITTRTLSTRLAPNADR